MTSGVRGRTRRAAEPKPRPMNISKLPKEARALRPASHPPCANGRVGVLIVNLGTPEGTDYWSIGAIAGVPL